MRIKIFATDPFDGKRFEITDLYWFEENGVHDFGGEGHWGRKYKLEVLFQEPKINRVLFLANELANIHIGDTDEVGIMAREFLSLLDRIKLE